MEQSFGSILKVANIPSRQSLSLVAHSSKSSPTVYKLSRGEICAAPENGASQGNYFRQKNQFSHKLATFEAKTSFQKQLWRPKLQTFFDEVIIIWLVRDEVKDNQYWQH